MFLPQEGSKTISILVLIAGLTLVMIIAFARFIPGTFVHLNRVFIKNGTYGKDKRVLEKLEKAATRTMRTRTAGPRSTVPPGARPPLIAPKAVPPVSAE